MGISLSAEKIKKICVYLVLSVIFVLLIFVLPSTHEDNVYGSEQERPYIDTYENSKYYDNFVYGFIDNAAIASVTTYETVPFSSSNDDRQSQPTPQAIEKVSLESVKYSWISDYIGNDDPDAIDSIDPDHLGEWEPGWFIVHNFSQTGKEILTLDVGDVVLINDDLYIKIDGFLSMERDCLDNDVFMEIGYAPIILQTCYDDSTIAVFYGHKVDAH